MLLCFGSEHAQKIYAVHLVWHRAHTEIIRNSRVQGLHLADDGYLAFTEP